MTVHPRQVTPSLLQIDSVRARLTGGALADEICRFLRSEFTDYRSVTIYRIRDGRVRPEGSDGETVPFPEGPVSETPVASVIQSGRFAIEQGTVVSVPPPATGTGVRSRLVVPVLHEAKAVAVIVVESGSFAPLDGSDARFLTLVGERLAPALSGA